MNKPNKKTHPPRWAVQLLTWYCRPSLLEDLQGDLNEYFDRNLKAKGATRARLIYVLDVIKFFRSYTIRKPEFINLLIHWIMIGSYIKTSSRSIVRNKLFSAINIIGLAISMSVGLLMIAFITDLLSYDDFQAKKDRIYRVITVDQRNENPPMTLACSSVRTGKSIQESVTGVEQVTLLRRNFGGDATVGETVIPLNGLWADASFFTVFDFPMLQGDPATALKEPYSLVLTEKAAKKLFGDVNALGRSVKLDTVNYSVTGIVKDLPKLSHMRFEALASFAGVELAKPNQDGDFMSWENIYSNYTYLMLPENGNAQNVQASLDKLSAAENAKLQNRKITLELQPLKDITLRANIANPIGPGINKIALWILGGLALVVILSACFNYTNLSIARSLRRSREVGIRKVMGALKGHVLGQFIAEAMIISLLSLLFSFLLFLALRTQFLSLAPQLQDLLSLELSPKLIFWFVVMAMTVGLVAGFLPALFFSRINAIQVLKDASSLKVFRHVNMRKALIVVQYVFSLIFITTTIIGYNQYKSFLSFDLGFKTENILNIKLQGNKSNLVIKELEELPSVKGISTSRVVTSIGNIYGMQVKYNNDSAGVWLNVVNEQHLPLHEHKFLAGKNFNAKSPEAEESEVIVNEQILKRFSIGQKDPVKALGEVLLTSDRKKLTIVGVIKDFHYGTLEDKIEPMIFRYSSEETFGQVNVKIASTDLPGTMGDIEKAWKKIDKVHPLDAMFYDDQLEQAYKQFSVMVKVIGFLAFLAVCIASMGLFGMVVFTTETRLKEISIRKVLGASEGRLVYLLSKGFIILLVLSALVALPATYLFFDKVVLTKFAYHQPIGLTELLISFLCVAVIAFVMIASQTLKAARNNPAQVLKNE
jgi:ABC-type antimicrobial peptide transport system permease subunit